MTDLEQSYYPYMSAIEKKVNRLLDEYAASQFDKLLEQEHITCEPMYHLANSIAPAKTISSIPKSLYVEEEQFDNEYEKKVYIFMGIVFCAGVICFRGRTASRGCKQKSSKSRCHPYRQ